MAKAAGKLISATSEDFRGDRFARVGATVTIGLPKGMKVIGKREDCKGYSTVSSNFWTRCKTFQEFVASRYCPCHNWKAGKK